MNTEERKFIQEFQKEFIQVYLCKPPIELLEAMVYIHRLNLAFEKILNNIRIQLSSPNSNLNMQLQSQVSVLSNRMIN